LRRSCRPVVSRTCKGRRNVRFQPQVRRGSRIPDCDRRCQFSDAARCTDGCTLLLAAPANAINATLYGGPSFGFIKESEPIAGFIRFPTPR
jgi:hypothetical protein